MNELTIHGNVTDEPTLRYSKNGTPILNFSVAVNRRRFDRQAGRWVDQAPVFHRVVAFKALAENGATTLAKGMTVTVTGELADDSWTPEDGKRQRRTQLQADDIAVSLRYATATVTKNRRDQDGDEPSDAEPLRARSAGPGRAEGREHAHYRRLSERECGGAGEPDAAALPCLCTAAGPHYSAVPHRPGACSGALAAPRVPGRRWASRLSPRRRRDGAREPAGAPGQGAARSPAASLAPRPNPGQ